VSIQFDFGTAFFSTNLALKRDGARILLNAVTPTTRIYSKVYLTTRHFRLLTQAVKSLQPEHPQQSLTDSSRRVFQCRGQVLLRTLGRHSRASKWMNGWWPTWVAFTGQEHLKQSRIFWKVCARSPPPVAKGTTCYRDD
jgi:hypothetical protein